MWLVIDWKRVGLDCPRLVARFTSVPEGAWNDDHSWKILGNGVLELGQTGTGLILYHNWFAKIPWDVYAFRLG